MALPLLIPIIAMALGTAMQVGSRFAKPGSGTQQGLQYGGLGLSALGGLGIGAAGAAGGLAGGAAAGGASGASLAGGTSGLSIAPGLLNSSFAGLAPTTAASTAIPATLPTFAYQSAPGLSLGAGGSSVASSGSLFNSQQISRMLDLLPEDKKPQPTINPPQIKPQAGGKPATKVIALPRSNFYPVQFDLRATRPRRLA